MQICHNCGEELPERFRLCGFCGATLGQLTARRTVTIVFADLVGSTRLGGRIDSESLWEVLGVYFDGMKAALERHGGSVEKYIGDAVMAVFGLAAAHEDDALRAIRAALDMRAALAAVNARLKPRFGLTLENRTGVNTGEIVAGDPALGQRLVSGDAVNVAARLEQAAEAGEILLGPTTYRLVQHAVDADALDPLELKGKGRVPAYRLVGLRGVEAIPRRTDTPMVGRVEEMALLHFLFRRAARGRTCQVATIIGLPGLGKSRLVTELLSEVGREAAVLQGRCLSYGDDTFWPLAEVIRQAAGIGSDDTAASARSKLERLLAEDIPDVTAPGNMADETCSRAVDRLTSLTGFSPEVFNVDESLWAVRTMLESVARQRPAIVVFDDVHWGEPTFLDLIERLVESTREAAVLILCIARPELLEERPEWMKGRSRAQQITLEELSVDESALVVRNILGNSGLPPTLEARVLDAAQGNPLFVEQMIAMLVDDGVLFGSQEAGWSVNGAPTDVAVPDSIASLLAARLDRLPRLECQLLERASVIGQVFYPPALGAMGDGDGDGDEYYRAALDSLVSKHFVEPAETDIDIAGTGACRFVHILVRDAAYRRLLKRARARLHERFGDWLTQMAGPGLADYEEIIGYHLEQAFHYCGELGEPDDHARSLGKRASLHLRAAGYRALSRGDMPAAGSILHRAAKLLPKEERDGAGLLIDVGDALLEVGDLSTAGKVLEEAVARAEVLGEGKLSTLARLALLYLRYMTDPGAVEVQVVEEARAAISAFSDPEDHDVLGRAWRLLTGVHWMASMFGPAEEALEECVRHAEARGDEVTARRLLGGLISCATYGPRPVKTAISRCEDVLTRAQDRKVTALGECAMARLEAMRGRFEQARTLYRRSRAMLEEFGWSFLASLTSIDAGPVEMLARDFPAAERELRKDYEALQAMNERNYISTVAGLLATAVYEQGRLEEAESLAATAAALGSPDDVTTQYLWRSVRAKVLARQGAQEEAESLALEAVALIDDSDFLDAQACARMDLAEVYQLAGLTEKQGRALAEAMERFELKGNTVGVEAARMARAASVAYAPYPLLPSSSRSN